jgi:hypothetical protein
LAALNVPKNERLALTILRQLPPLAFGQLLAELERSPTSVPEVPNLSADDAESVFESISSLHRVRAYSEVPVEEFIVDVCESLIEHNDLSPMQAPEFRERLTRILEIEALRVAGKAIALHTEHENLFCSARILTDARPIYGDDPSVLPMAMIINHTLKLDYHTGSGGHIAEFYVALGSRDIQELHDVLTRAEKKAKSLGAAMSNASIRIIDPQA